jgi:hypothetical protein
VMLAGQPLTLSLEMERFKVHSIVPPVKKVIFDGIDWRMQDVPGNCGIDYVANGIEFMCRIYCVQMIGRLKNLHHWMDLWWDCYFDNNINKLTIHETKIQYGNKVSTVKGDTVFWGTELELFNSVALRMRKKCHPPGEKDE